MTPAGGGGARRHPDAVLLSRAGDALTWWAAQTPSTPTSSVTGGGAVAALEQHVGGLLARPALALPNATFALRVALLAVGVRPDDDVLVPALDWPAGRAAARSIGARPVPVPVDEATLTVDPVAVAATRTRRATALVVTHLHGVCADVPALRCALGGDLPIVEDAAQGFGATLDGLPAGALGDVGVISFGPGKVVDAGEIAVLVGRDDDLFDRAVGLSQHPVRQRLNGVPRPVLDHLTGRAAPLSALLAAYELSRWRGRVERLRATEDALGQRLGAAPCGAVALAGPPRRAAVPGRLPVLMRSRDDDPVCDGATVCRSGAEPARELPETERIRLQALADRARLLVVDEPPSGADAP